MSLVTGTPASRASRAARIDDLFIDRVDVHAAAPPTPSPASPRLATARRRLPRSHSTHAIAGVLVDEDHRIPTWPSRTTAQDGRRRRPPAAPRARCDRSRRRRTRRRRRPSVRAAHTPHRRRDLPARTARMSPRCASCDAAPGCGETGHGRRNRRSSRRRRGHRMRGQSSVAMLDSDTFGPSPDSGFATALVQRDCRRGGDVQRVDCQRPSESRARRSQRGDRVIGDSPSPSWPTQQRRCCWPARRPRHVADGRFRTRRQADDVVTPCLRSAGQRLPAMGRCARTAARAPLPSRFVWPCDTADRWTLQSEQHAIGAERDGIAEDGADVVGIGHAFEDARAGVHRLPRACASPALS